MASNLKTIVASSINQDKIALGKSPNLEQMEQVHNMLDALAKELVEKIDEDGNENIEWKEFKQHLTLVEERIAAVKTYVRNYVMQS